MKDRNDTDDRGMNLTDGLEFVVYRMLVAPIILHY